MSPHQSSHSNHRNGGISTPNDQVRIRGNPNHLNHNNTKHDNPLMKRSSFTELSSSTTNQIKPFTSSSSSSSSSSSGMTLVFLIKMMVGLCFLWLLSSTVVSIATIFRHENIKQQQQQQVGRYERSSRMTSVSTNPDHPDHMIAPMTQSAITNDRKNMNNNNDNKNNNTQKNDPNRCAILFWGLPRSYRTLVLPSIIQNIILPNRMYKCDYYIHYYYQHEEIAGRSGQGGIINPDDILQLKDAIYNITNPTSSSSYRPTIQFINDTETQFWFQYSELIETIRTTKDAQNKNYLYFPWKAKTYQHPTTTDNIIKMWHSIQSVWNLMMLSASQQQLQLSSSSNIPYYQQIGMFRSDVVYLTPMDIYENPEEKAKKNHHDQQQRQQKPFVVIPNFGNYPVSDRMIYGHYDGVKIWATNRFDLLHTHVNWIYQYDSGWGLHSERYMNYTIFPYIRSNGTTTITLPSNTINNDQKEKDVITIVRHPTMCFVRARSDESIWMNDCIVGLQLKKNLNKKKNLPTPPTTTIISDPRIYENLGGTTSSIQQHIEHIIGRSCQSMKSSRKTVMAINCSSSSGSSTTS
jgi:hypothetical protein